MSGIFSRVLSFCSLVGFAISPTLFGAPIDPTENMPPGTLVGTPIVTEEDLVLASPFPKPTLDLSRPIKGVVFFDLGNVLIEVEWPRFLLNAMALIQSHNPQFSRKEAEDLLANIQKSWLIPNWSKGVVGPYEFAENLSTFLEVPNASLNELRMLHKTILGAERKPVVQVLKQLKENGWAIGLLSNTNPWHEADLRQSATWWDWVDFTVFSHDFGYAKPHHLIFEKALQEAQRVFNAPWLTGKDCYLIDDVPFNITIARSSHLGWNGALLNTQNGTIQDGVIPTPASHDELGKRTFALFENLLE